MLIPVTVKFAEYELTVNIPETDIFSMYGRKEEELPTGQLRDFLREAIANIVVNSESENDLIRIGDYWIKISFIQWIHI